MESNSPKLKLNAIDWGKIFKGLIIALIGATLTYLTHIITGLEWGPLDGVIMSVWSTLANAIRKWMVDYSK